MNRKTHREIIDELLPWVRELVGCLVCGTGWVTVRTVGTDYRRLQCPFCGSHRSELASEIPLMFATAH